MHLLDGKKEWMGMRMRDGDMVGVGNDGIA